MTETNRVMTEEERAAYNRDLMRELRWVAAKSRQSYINLAADWLEWHIEQMEIDDA